MSGGSCVPTELYYKGKLLARELYCADPWSRTVHRPKTQPCPMRSWLGPTVAVDWAQCALQRTNDTDDSGNIIQRASQVLISASENSARQGHNSHSTDEDTNPRAGANTLEMLTAPVLTPNPTASTPKHFLSHPYRMDWWVSRKPLRKKHPRHGAQHLITFIHFLSPGTSVLERGWIALWSQFTWVHALCYFLGVHVFRPITQLLQPQFSCLWRGYRSMSY